MSFVDHFTTLQPDLHHRIVNAFLDTPSAVNLSSTCSTFYHLVKPHLTSSSRQSQISALGIEPSIVHSLSNPSHSSDSSLESPTFESLFLDVRHLILHDHLPLISRFMFSFVSKFYHELLHPTIPTEGLGALLGGDIGSMGLSQCLDWIQTCTPWVIDESFLKMVLINTVVSGDVNFLKELPLSDASGFIRLQFHSQGPAFSLRIFPLAVLIGLSGSGEVLDFFSKQILYLRGCMYLILLGAACGKHIPFIKSHINWDNPLVVMEGIINAISKGRVDYLDGLGVEIDIPKAELLFHLTHTSEQFILISHYVTRMCFKYDPEVVRQHAELIGEDAIEYFDCVLNRK